MLNRLYISSVLIGKADKRYFGSQHASIFKTGPHMNILFLIFSTGAVVSAGSVLRSKNPVHAVFYLVSVFLHVSGLLCLLGYEYFALLQLLVYVGALAIMFLFVIMLLDIPATEMVAYQRGAYPAAGILCFCLGAAVYASVFLQEENSPLQIPMISTELAIPENAWGVLKSNTDPVEMLGVALYGMHIDLLIVASYVLLVAMVGAVALTLKRRVQAPNHDVFAQHNRDFQKVVINVRSSKIFIYL